MTALHYAATEGKAEAIAVLLDHQAYPNFMDSSSERYSMTCMTLTAHDDFYLFVLVDIHHWTMLYCTIIQFVLMC